MVWERDRLQKGFKAHEVYLALIQVEPMYDNLTSDARYLELQRQMNLRP